MNTRAPFAASPLPVRAPAGEHIPQCPKALQHTLCSVDVSFAPPSVPEVHSLRRLRDLRSVLLPRVLSTRCPQLTTQGRLSHCAYGPDGSHRLTRAVLVVSHHLDGLLRNRACRLVASCSRSWGSSHSPHPQNVRASEEALGTHLSVWPSVLCMPPLRCRVPFEVFFQQIAETGHPIAGFTRRLCFPLAVAVHLNQTKCRLRHSTDVSKNADSPQHMRRCMHSTSRFAPQ